MTDAGVPPMREYARDPLPTPPAVWFGLAAGPLAWGTQLGLGWWVSGNTCADGTPEWGPLSASAVWLIQIGISTAAVAVTGAALYAAWGAWRRTSRAAPRLTAINGDQRVGFMAAAGVLISGLFVFATLLTGMAVATVSVCEYMR